MMMVPASVPAPVSAPTVIESQDKRVAVWNRTTKRKVAGNAAPMHKNLSEYLQRHPDCELYHGQDAKMSPEEKKAIIAAQNRIAIWNKVTRRRVSGNAAPREKKLEEYLRKHPECEVYNGQDKLPMESQTTPVFSNSSSAQVPAALVGIKHGSAPRAAAPRVQSHHHHEPEDLWSMPVQDDIWGEQLPQPGAVPIAVPKASEFSIADMYGNEFGDMYDDVFTVGSLGKVSAQSLEGVMGGMSLDDMGAFGSFSGSLGLSGSFGGDLGFLGGTVGSLDDPLLDSVPGRPGAVPVPMSSAQRIKRDRAFSCDRARSNSYGSQNAGSAIPHPAQRLRQGPGPGSIPNQPIGLVGTPTGANSFGVDPGSLTDFWPMSPGGVPL